MIGPITKNAILGVMFGVIALPIWASLSHQLAIQTSLLVGFAGGLVGGTTWGAFRRLQDGRA